MVPVELIERTRLHDAVVESLTLTGDVVRLTCSSVLVSAEGNGDPHSVIVTLGGVSSVACDDIPIAAIAPEGDYGSVLGFSRDGNVATLLMEWHRFAPRDTITRVYTIQFRTFGIVAEREGAG